MAQRVYATTAEYAAFAEEPSELADVALLKRLRSASVEVDGLTRTARYNVDSGGNPVDAAIDAAFTDATCAIVEHWSITDDPTGAHALAGAVKIGSVSLGTTSRSASSETAEEKLLARIGEKAVTILTNAGLRSSSIRYR